MRSGTKKGRRTLVVHARVDTAEVRTGGPRLGLIVSKAVGDAVTRHRVSRRLRHVSGPVLDTLPDDVRLVVRALPAAAAAGSDELDRDLRSAARVAAERAREAVR